MNEKQDLIPIGHTRISIIIVFFSTLFLTACAGQQSAKHLAGLEVTAMLDYKQLINRRIEAEEKYYIDAHNQLNHKLETMNDRVGSETFMSRRALQYEHLWQKDSISRYDILLMIDSVYPDFRVAEKEYEDQIAKIDEQYFSKVEKLGVQQDNIEKSISSLGKLISGDKLTDQANLVKDYLIGTLKTIRELSEPLNKEDSHGK